MLKVTHRPCTPGARSVTVSRCRARLVYLAPTNGPGRLCTRVGTSPLGVLGGYMTLFSSFLMIPGRLFAPHPLSSHGPRRALCASSLLFSWSQEALCASSSTHLRVPGRQYVPRCDSPGYPGGSIRHVMTGAKVPGRHYTPRRDC